MHTSCVRSLLALALIFVAMLCGAAWSDPRPPWPDGWRPPNSSEVGTHRVTHAAAEGHLEVRGDFNGDGLTDQAYLLVHRDGSRFALFALVAGANGKWKSEELFEDRDLASLRNVGISLVKPGRYLTTCGKGYVPCGPDEGPYVTLIHDALDYYREESARVYYYWTGASESAKVAYISD